jgi:hypothetical protein
MSPVLTLQPALAPFDRPLCPECDTPMFIVTVEPDGPNNESRTYECPRCKFIETNVVRC